MRGRRWYFTVLLATWGSAGTGWSAAPDREPLNPPGAPPDTGALFERLAPEQTGITLSHAFPEDADFALMADQNSGSGVCIGDVDADGLPDLFFTAYNQGCRLYRNLGGWRFEDITDQAKVGGEGRWCAGCAFIDIDNDGDLDLSVAVYDGPNLLYVNDGTGVFTEDAAARGLAFAGSSVMVAFADYDLDGDLDGYLVTHRMQDGTRYHPPGSSKEAYDRGIIVADRATRTVRVTPGFRDLFTLWDKGGGRIELATAGQEDILYRNDGGGFTAVGTSAGIIGNDIGLAASWWDFDDDGYPDLYVSNDYKGPDRLYHNNHDGTFTDVTRDVLPHTPWLSMGSDSADVDNDGRVDFLATDMAGTNHFNQKMGMGDMSKDLWFLTASDPQQYMRNAIYLNTGTGRAMEVAHLAGLASSDWTWSPKFGDYDNDGDADLFVTNGMSRDFMNGDLAKQIKGWRGEGWRDTPVHRQPNLAFRNDGELRFAATGEAWGLAQVAASYGAATADLDRDGDLDLVHTNFDEPVSVYRNGGTGNAGLLVRLVGTRGNRWGIGAKVTVTSAGGDSRRQVQVLQSARGFMSANEPVLHFGMGEAQEIESLTVDWPGGVRQVVRGLRTNELVTVTESNDGDGEPGSGRPEEDGRARRWFERGAPLPGLIHREAPFDDFEREPLLPSKLSRLGPPLAVSRDGDLFLGGAAGQAGMLRPTGGAGGVITFDAESASEDAGAVFFDAEGDGDQDLYVVSGGVECEPGGGVLRDRLYRNSGGGNWVHDPAALPGDLSDSGSCVACADADGDGDLDLFVGGRSVPGRYPVASPSRLLRNDGLGRFTDVTAGSAPGVAALGIVTAAAWLEPATGAPPSLLICQEWGPPVLLVNRDGNLVHGAPNQALAPYSGWWNALASTDLDGDGDTDFVAGNAGLNTKYHASPGSPALLYFGEFEAGGQPQIIEAEFESGTLFPGRGRSCSTAAIPALGDRFSTYREFALATLPEIYSQERLDSSMRLEATTLESGAFLNDGDGKFRFEPFPRLAQAAPVFGIAVSDVDHDGVPDVYLVGNHFSPQPETGRMDGGISLLLLGRGDGTFAVAPPSASGLVLPGDSKSVVVLDVDRDGRDDFVVGQNNAPLAWFKRTGG